MLAGGTARAASATPPRRIVSLSWAGAQIAASLGVMPLAITERANYPRIGTAPPMAPEVLELGLHAEPNLELILSLHPDLILLDVDQADLGDRLRRIAPILPLDIYDPALGRPWQRACAETRRVAAALALSEQAETVLRDDRAAIEGAGARLSGTTPLPVLVVDLYDDGRHLFVYGEGSLIQDGLDMIGLRNAWPHPMRDGYVLIRIEDLAGLPDALMMFISHGSSDALALNNLDRSALWNALPFAGTGRFRPLPGFFTYGATASAVQFAHGITAAIAGGTASSGSAARNDHG